MLKKLIAALAILIVVVVSCAAMLVSYANSLVQSHKGDIERQLSDALKAPVSFASVEVSLFPSIELYVQDLAVRDATGGTGGLSLKALRVGAELRPLLSKQLVFREIILDSPDVRLVQANGQISIQGLGNDAGPGQRAVPGGPPAAASAPAPAKYSLAIQRVLVHDGTLTATLSPKGPPLVVKSVEIDAGVVIQGASISVPELLASASLNEDHPLQVSARDVSFAGESGSIDIPSLSLSGKAGSLSAAGKTDPAGGGQFTLSSDSIDLGLLAPELTRMLPALHAVRPGGKVRLQGSVALSKGQPPVLNGSVSGVNVSAHLSPSQSLSAMNGTISASGPVNTLRIDAQNLSLLSNNAPLNIDASALLTAKGLEFSKLIVRGFGGSVAAPVRLSLGQPAAFSSPINASAIDLTKAFDAFTSPSLSQTFTGTLKSLSGSVSGTADGSLAQTLKTDGTMLITDGVLKGNNLPMAVLNQLSSIPVFAGLLSSGVPEKYKGRATANDTAIYELSGSFSVAQGQTTLKGVNVVSDMCSFTVDGTVSRDGSLDISSTFTFSPDLSMGLVKSFKGLNRALNSAQQLVVPVVIRGRPPMLAVLPDVTKLLTGTITNLPKEALGIVGGIFGLGPSSDGDSKKAPNQGGKAPQNR